MSIFGSPPSANDALALVGRLNRGILFDEEWEGALSALATYVGADSAAYVIRDRRRNQFILYNGGLLPAELGNDYQVRFHEIDPALDRLEDAPIGSIYVDQLDFGTRNMAESDFYRHYLHPHGIESVMAMVVDRDEDNDWLIGFQRVRGRPLFDVANAVALRGLLAHLQTAFRLKHKLRELQHAQAWQQVAMNRLALPIMMVDDRLRVLSANWAGERWLAESDNPLTGTTAHPDLHQMIGRACGAAHPGQIGTFTAQGDNDRQGLMIAMPLPSLENKATDLLRPCALLIGIGCAPEVGPNDTLLRNLFSLTRSEIALAERLANGLTLTEASEQAGVARETIRTHLKSVLRKTGTRRQSELTALLTGLSMVRMS